jgi:hypothetical protein
MKLLFHALCLAAAAFSVFVLAASKAPAWGRQFLPHGGAFFGGDLYNKCLIDAFRGRIERREFGEAREDGTLESADAILIGDSFATTALDSDALPAELEKKAGLRVFTVLDSLAIDSPLAFLEKARYGKGARKPLLLVTAERSSLGRAATYARAYAAPGPGRFLRSLYAAFKDAAFIREDTTYFFTHNRFVFPAYKWLKNVRFALFREIDDANVPFYSLDPPMLFYRDEVDFNRAEKTAARIDAAAASVARLARELKARHNLELVYVVVPNKYSIYHDVLGAGHGYDGFLPALFRRLESAGVPTVDLYARYRAYREGGAPGLLYYPSDTHWTPLGKSLLVEECLNWFRKIEGYPS